MTEPAGRAGARPRSPWRGVLAALRASIPAARRGVPGSIPGTVPAALRASVVAALGVSLLAACGAPVSPAADGRLRVVTTTGILADMVRNVAGPDVEVDQIVPDGADPHAYEPRLRSVRDVAYADLAFSNYLMLEQHSIIRVLDANLPAQAPSVSIAEEASKAGATILPLVENRGLDALWLGLRVAGDGSQYGATRASTVDLSVTGVEGPGQAASFLTTAFGQPEIGFSSHDGFDAADGWAQDTETLPADAHQHMSWAFSKPGVYRVSVRAALRVDGASAPVPVPAATLVMAVGVDPHAVAQDEGRAVVSQGHADLTVDLDAGAMSVMVDAASAPDAAPRLPGAASVTGLVGMGLDDVVLEVPARTLAEVPGTAGFRFLGHPGDQVYLLPQAVLGKHVHGEIDPHLWQDVHNAAAYVRVIRDELIAVDPAHAQDYRRRAAAYLTRLEELDTEVANTIESIPPQRRHLVTTHDAYAYLANAYGLDVAGFVAPSPGVEPSLADRRRLSATLEGLDVPAVFLEPQLSRTRSALVTVAEQAGVRVCPLYGDTLDDQAPTYIDMMRFNASSLARCLGGEPLPMPNEGTS